MDNTVHQQARQSESYTDQYQDLPILTYSLKTPYTMTIEQEHQLLHRLQMRSVAAFKTFVVAYWEDLLLVTTSQVVDPIVADGLLSDLFLALYNDGFPDVSIPIRRSLFKKVIDLCADHLLEKFG